MAASERSLGGQTPAPPSPASPPILSLEEKDEDVEKKRNRRKIAEASCHPLCAASPCGPNGECVPINETSVECECAIYYDGPTCDVFKPIEHAARFDGASFMVFSADELPHLTSEREELVEFRFRTNDSEGLMFWQGQSPEMSAVGEDYVSVFLHRGHVVFAYELGGGAARLVSELTVDDEKVHSVRAWRKGRDGELRVDGRVVQGSSSGILAMLNAEGHIHLGGGADVEELTGGLHRASFIGCIADLSLNSHKLDLMGAAIDGRNVRPCDDWVPTRFLRRRKTRRPVFRYS